MTPNQKDRKTRRSAIDGTREVIRWAWNKSENDKGSVMDFDAWRGAKAPPPGGVPLSYIEDRAVPQATKQGAKGVSAAADIILLEWQGQI